jgi:hypothetical protein
VWLKLVQLWVSWFACPLQQLTFRDLPRSAGAHTSACIASEVCYNQVHHWLTLLFLNMHRSLAQNNKKFHMPNLVPTSGRLVGVPQGALGARPVGSRVAPRHVELLMYQFPQEQ